jgi:hypothetical protein
MQSPADFRKTIISRHTGYLATESHPPVTLMCQATGRFALDQVDYEVVTFRLPGDSLVKWGIEPTRSGSSKH